MPGGLPRLCDRRIGAFLYDEYLSASCRLRVYLAFCFVPALGFFLAAFPDGRFVPHWSWLLVVLFIAQGIAFVIPGPFNIMFWPPPLFGAELLLTYGGTLCVQIYRYVRVSNLSQRQQTKWLVFGLAGYIVLQILIGLFGILVPGLELRTQRINWSAECLRRSLSSILSPECRHCHPTFPLVGYRCPHSSHAGLYDPDRDLGTALRGPCVRLRVPAAWLLRPAANPLVIVASTLVIAPSSSPCVMASSASLIAASTAASTMPPGRTAFSATLRSEVDLNELREQPRDGGAGDDATSAYLPLAAPNHSEQERRSALERLASCALNMGEIC